MFCLIDCNNFYASCEQVFNPKLRNKPLVILSSNDGCVIARSKEAKDLKIPMGVPIFLYKELIKKECVILQSSNFALYGDMSRRVMSIIKDEEFPIEIYSIDEAFLLISNLDPLKLEIFAEKLRTKILKWTGISVSIGIAPTKTLAKVANVLAKQKQTSFIKIITTDAIDTSLKTFPVENLWGIGRAYEKTLANLGIKTALDLKRLPKSFIKNQLTVQGLQMVFELEGTSCFKLEELLDKRKSLMSTRSFSAPINNLKDMKSAISFFCAIASKKLRKDSLVCSYVNVFLSTDRFKEGYSSKSKQVTLKSPTNSIIPITKAALKTLDTLFDPKLFYKKAGVSLGGFEEETHCHVNFFEKPDPKEQKLMKAFDAISKRYGNGSIKLASQGDHKKWAPKREKKSPNYTGAWEDLLLVQI